MAVCLIGLGSNLGDRAANLQQALDLIANRIGRVSASSTFVTTHSIGGPSGQPDFLNAAALCETGQAPLEVLHALHEIECALGRQRHARWDARTIDLDLLIFDEVCSDSRDLVLPHPRMAFRRFVLEPADQFAADMIHPSTGFSIRELLHRLQVRPIHIVVLGAGSDLIAQRTADESGGVSLQQAIQQEFGSLDGPAGLRRLKERWKDWAVDAHRPMISNFWSGEWSLLASGMSADERASWESEIKSLPESLRLPHLLIWIEPASDADASLRNAISRPRQFPVLLLRDASVDDGVSEAVAAIAAME